MSQPYRVMGREDELCVGELLFEQVTNLTTVARIDGHEHIIQNREGECWSEQMSHKGEVQAEAHTVLVALAVICSGWKFTSSIEIHIEAQFANRRSQLRREFTFVVSVDVAIHLPKSS